MSRKASCPDMQRPHRPFEQWYHSWLELGRELYHACEVEALYLVNFELI